jgi:hypothetical protein
MGLLGQQLLTASGNLWVVLYTRKKKEAFRSDYNAFTLFRNLQHVRSVTLSRYVAHYCS